VTGSARDRWKRMQARLGIGAATEDLGAATEDLAGATEDLAAAEAYRLWSATYADETNELQRLEADLRREIVEELRGQRVLEVGAGTGRVTRDLIAGGAEVFATDLVAEMLLRAPTRSETAGRACVARAEQLPYRAGSFDAVVCALTIGHVADLSGALGSMVEVVRPGGALVLTGFHPEATLRGWRRTFSHAGVERSIEQHVHELSEYKRILGCLGCRIEELRERSWEGSVVLFGFRARRTPSAPSPRG